MKTWYEVFISNEESTRTLKTFDTLPKAKAFTKDLFKKGGLVLNYTQGTLHIDKWENRANPQKIGDII